MARSWPSVLGASRLPPTSLESPIPRDARRGCGRRRAARRRRRLSTNIPAPSPTTRPSAAASNGDGAPRRRQRAQLREAHLRVEAVGPRDAAGQHRVGAAGAQLVDRELERVQRRGAGRVEREGAAAEAEGPREHAARQARRRSGWPGSSAPREARAPSGRALPRSKPGRRSSRAHADAASVGSASWPITTPTRSRSAREASPRRKPVERDWRKCHSGAA